MKLHFHTNKGFTIIELIVAISLFLIVSSLVLRQFIISIFGFKKEVSIDCDNIYSITAIDTLSELINEADLNSININSNAISYNYRGEKREIKIERSLSNEDNLIINYYNVFGTRVTKKYIAKNLNNFSILEKGKVIYISLENNKGSAYNKCIVKK